MNKYKTIVSIALVFFMSYSLMGQQKKEFTDVSEKSTEKKVQWLTLNEAVEKNSKEQRPIFIDVYTDWCGWCKVLDNKTFSNDHVAKLLNEKYYPVKFNAEQKEDLEFLGNVYKYVPQNKSNEFAVALLEGKMGYPSIVFLEVIPGDKPEVAKLYMVQSFIDAKKFHQIATYFNGNYYPKVDWETYSAEYKSPIN